MFNVRNHILNFIFILFIGLENTSFTLAKDGGDWVGNGAGLAENNILFSYWNLESSYKQALSEASLTTEEKNLLQKMLDVLSEELGTNEQVRFLSGQKYPRFFPLDNHGNIRIAVTGDKVGSLIYFNTDLLYQREEGKIVALSVTQATSLLVHELGHHHGIKNHQVLDQLGSKVAMSLQRDQLRITMGVRDSHIVAETLRFRSDDLSDALALQDGESIFNLNHLKNHPELCTDGKFIRGLKIWQIGWNFYPHPHLIVNVAYYCAIGGEVLQQEGENYFQITPFFLKDHQKQTRIQKINIQLRKCHGHNTHDRQCRINQLGWQHQLMEEL
jgi:hypothetical protein